MAIGGGLVDHPLVPSVSVLVVRVKVVPVTVDSCPRQVVPTKDMDGVNFIKCQLV